MTMRAILTDPANELSKHARQLLEYLYAEYRNQRSVLSCDDIAAHLPLTKQSVDEAARELSVCGGVKLTQTSAGTLVVLQDAGIVEAVRSRRNPNGLHRRVGLWLLDHVVKIILGLILAALIAWIGIG
jgi:hypothetical protein